MMEVDVNPGGFTDDLFVDDSERWMPAVRQMKNTVIGNNKQKSHMLNIGVVPRLLELMGNDKTHMELKVECASVLGSLAKGGEGNNRILVDAGCIGALLQGLNSTELRYIEACLRCLRTIYTKEVSVDEIYRDPGVIPQLVKLMSRSTVTMECVTTVLASCCREREHQEILWRHCSMEELATLLCCGIYRVQMPTLRCVSQMCYRNENVASIVVSVTHNGDQMPILLSRLLQRDKPTDMQMQAAKCLTYLHRAGAMDSTDPIVCLKTLSCLVRMCKEDKTWEERVEGAETLAYLIEVDIELQRTAAVSDHIITTLTGYFKYPGSPVDASLMPKIKDDIVVGNELRQAAFKAYASLGANDEDIRKRVIDTENLMNHIVNGLSDPVRKVQLAAVRCLHSLSRSVQQLRTSLQDHSVWKPLMKILKSANEEVLPVASSTLCNLLLEFSPCKEPIVADGAVQFLVNLTKLDDANLRLNGVWGLMNLTFQSEQKVKSDILSALGADQIFRLLTDSDVNILMKTLGLLRNLLSSKPHIDSIMDKHGDQVMQAVVLILEGDHGIDVKEQALCILANVADGDSAKQYIMGNEDVLKKLMNYMIYNNVKLQIAATFCVSNLIWNKDEGATERQAKLNEMGVQKILQQLLSTTDSVLFDKVKTALQQF